MVNEAMAVLREGMVADADLIDAGVIFGSGFAPFRGGPLRYARERGVREVVARLEALASKHGERFRPDPGWAGFGGPGRRDTILHLLQPAFMSSDPTTVELSVLRAFSPLDGLKNENLRALARKTVIREMPQGRLLFKEGDTEKRTILPR